MRPVRTLDLDRTDPGSPGTDESRNAGSPAERGRSSGTRAVQRAADAGMSAMRTPATYAGTPQGCELSRTVSRRSQITALTPGVAVTLHLSELSVNDDVPSDLRESAQELAHVKQIAADLNQGIAELQAELAEERELLSAHRRANPSPPATGGGGRPERGASMVGTMQPARSPPASSPRRMGGGAAVAGSILRTSPDFAAAGAGGGGGGDGGGDSSQKLRAASVAKVAGA